MKSHIHALKAKDATGRWAYYYIYVFSTKRALFEEALKGKEVIDLTRYGEVAACNYGTEPNEETKRIMREKYGLVL